MHNNKVYTNVEVKGPITIKILENANCRKNK